MLGSPHKFFDYERHALNTNSDEATLREEVDFWRRFIEHWERVNSSPPHPRMLEALAYAEHKLRTHLESKSQDEYSQDTGDADRRLH